MSIARDLFDLIKSLTPSEKGNFKKAVTQKKDEKTNYYQLYNAFLKLDEFCSDTVEKKYKKAPSTKECSDLFLKIFSNLRSSSNVKSPQLLIREKLQNAEILYSRDIYEKSFKDLEKVKKDAYKIEDYPVILEIIDKQRYVQRYLKSDPVKQLELQKEYDKTLVILNLKNKLDILWEHYVLVTNSKGDQKAKEIDKLKEKVNLIDHNAITSQDSSLLRIRYYYLLANISLFTGDSSAALEYSQLVLDEYNKKQTLKQANEEVYSNHLLGYFHRLVEFKQAKLIDEKLIQEFETILNKNVKRSATNFENLYMFLCYYHLNLGNFEIFESFISPIEAGLNKFKHKVKIDYQRVFISNISSFYFLREDFEQCRVWLERQIYHPNSLSNKNRIAMSKLLDCFVSIEMDDIEGMDNCIRRVSDYIRRVNYTNPFLVDVLQFLKGFAASLPGEKKEKITTLCSTIEVQREASIFYEKQLFFNEIFLWLNSKQNGKKITTNYMETFINN